MSTLIAILSIAAGLALLVKGGDWLVSGASGLARAGGVSDLATGLTVVAFGTSMPEFIVSILASVRDANAITVGNVIGSNICNIFLILGVAALIHPLLAAGNTVWREIPFVLLASVLVVVLANDTLLDGAAENMLTRSDGLVLLAVFGVFLFYVGVLIRTAGPNEPLGEEVSEIIPLRKSVLYLILGLIGLIAGGQLAVNGAVAIATSFGVSEFLIGVTIVAVGTSLPELATSAVAAYKKNADIAIGNIVGSNIFNIFFVLGLSSTIHPIPFGTDRNPDLAAMLLAAFLLFLAMFTGKPKHQIQRWEGFSFLGLYAAYTIWVVVRG